MLLFIHGGGWISGTRREFCRPLFSEFLRRGFVVATIDYRLLPESDFRTGQLEDIRDSEHWLKVTLPTVLQEKYPGLQVDTSSVIVCGASAGSHLATFTVRSALSSLRAILCNQKT